ncbi:MAG TPA: polysaccharide deacetylase family protein [Ignavibacteriaceae bacterium]|nr:polysaccharide deacetylase family protein [Ignavibacteriaceae bacterium]
MHNSKKYIIAIVSFFLILISPCVNLIAKATISDTSDYGKVFVTRWAEDRKSAFSFSFDDGFKAQYDNVRTILDSYDFNATYFLLPPFLTEQLPGIWRYGTWPMFLEMHSEGSELGSHSLNHPHLLQLPVGDTLTQNTIHYELYHSKKMIEARTNYEKCITFAYPYAEHNAMLDSLASLYYESSRAIGISPNHFSLSGLEWHSLKSFEVIFSEPRIVLEDDLDELYNFMNWIENSIANGKWGIHLAHEVVPFAQLGDFISQGAYNPISNEWLILLCEWLAEKSYDNLIWIESIGNITRYIKERDAHSYQVLSQSNSLIEISLTDNLPDNIYNYPLTAYISIPETWEKVLLIQGNNSKVYETFSLDTMQVLLAQIIPDNGIIQLYDHTSTFVEVENNQPTDFILNQNYPNPFNPTTTISYEIKNSGYVSLNLYDILGNKISELFAGEKSAGKHSVLFDAGYLPSGVYTYVLNIGGKYQSKKLMLIK